MNCLLFDMCAISSHNINNVTFSSCRRPGVSPECPGVWVHLACGSGRRPPARRPAAARCRRRRSGAARRAAGAAARPGWACRRRQGWTAGYTAPSRRSYCSTHGTSVTDRGVQGGKWSYRSWGSGDAVSPRGPGRSPGSQVVILAEMSGIG